MALVAVRQRILNDLSAGGGGVVREVDIEGNKSGFVNLPVVITHQKSKKKKFWLKKKKKKKHEAF